MRRCRISTEGAAKWADAANEAQQAARLGTTGSRGEWGVGGAADGEAKSGPKGCVKGPGASSGCEKDKAAKCTANL